MTHLFIIFVLSLNNQTGATRRTAIIQILSVASKEQCDGLLKVFNNPPKRKRERYESFVFFNPSDFLTEAACMPIDAVTP